MPIEVLLERPLIGIGCHPAYDPNATETLSIDRSKIYHDPILCVIGPDASRIADKTLRNLKSHLLPKMYNIKINTETVNDYSNITGCRKTEVIKKMSEIFEEAEMALKMNLLKENEINTTKPSKTGRLSKEILRKVKLQKRHKTFESHNIDDLLNFGVITTMLLVLFIILAKTL